MFLEYYIFVVASAFNVIFAKPYVGGNRDLGQPIVLPYVVAILQGFKNS